MAKELPAEYKYVEPVLALIAKDFGYELQEGEVDRLEDCALAAFAIDEAFDQLNNIDEVQAFARQAIAFLVQGDGTLLEAIDRTHADVAIHLNFLRGLAVEDDVLNEFVDLSTDLFNVMYEPRVTKCVDAYLNQKVEEGRLSAEMALLFFLKEASPAMRTFMVHAVIAFNLMDDFNDLEKDYEAGMTVIPPSLSFRLKIFLRALGELWEAFKLYPKKQSFLKFWSRSNFE